MKTDYRCVDSIYPTKEQLRFFRCELRHWYSANRRRYYWRRKSSSVYVRVISEILLQRTRADTVGRFAKTFFKNYPSWNRLALASEIELQETLKPLGLWHQRSKSLVRLAKVISHNNGRLPKNREDIETLPCAGQYVTNSILLFAHCKPEPLLDANMARLLERFFGPRRMVDIRYDPYLQRLSRDVISCGDPKELNWAILDFAALICTTRNPKHNSCPLAPRCIFNG